MQAMFLVVLSLSAVAFARRIQPFTDAENSFYDLCDKTDSVKCVGAGGGNNIVPVDVCLEARNCTKAVAMETAADGFIFHMIATNNVSYVALGFSMDKSMGDDPVAACVRNEDSTITGVLSYNIGRTNNKADSNDDLTVTESSSVDGVMYCVLKFADTLKFARHVENNTDSDFYLIAVSGGVNADGSLGRHSGQIFSDEKWYFGENKEDSNYFYDMCSEENVKCAGPWSKTESDPGSCLDSRNCTKALAMEDTDAGLVFHLLAVGDVSYVALGFSKDTGMGEDSVVACVKNGAEVTGTLSYNIGKTNEPSQSNEGLTLHETKVEDETIYCKFSLEDTLKYARHYDNNTDKQFYIIGVSGILNEDGHLGHHSGHILSNEMWSLPSGAYSTSASIILSAAAFLLMRL